MTTTHTPFLGRPTSAPRVMSKPNSGPTYRRTEQAVAMSPASVAAVATMTDELALTGSAWDADKEAAGVPSLLRSEDGRGSWLVRSEILGKLA